MSGNRLDTVLNLVQMQTQQLERMAKRQDALEEKFGELPDLLSVAIQEAVKAGGEGAGEAQPGQKDAESKGSKDSLSDSFKKKFRELEG
jgi:hypothetical protein